MGEIKDSKVTLSYTGGTQTVTVGGEAAELTGIGFGDKVFVQITQNAKTKAYTLSLRFVGDKIAIPAGGSGVLSVSTRAANETPDNTVYLNTCYITPMRQTWDNTTNKGNVTQQDIPGQQADDKTSVRGSAPVTVADGYATSAIKSIEEKEDQTNCSDSKQEVNYISLDSKDKLFTYGLTVNGPAVAMKELILIDSLPDAGDHSVFQSDDPRCSAFRVSLAEEPNIVVKVNGTALSSSQYTVEYNDTENQVFTKDDWAGTSKWNDSPENARAIRVKILDESGETIPANATITISFDAKVDSDKAEPGTIAWNSFGYHYTVVGSSTALEAAPLKVGVKIPLMPTAQKVVKNSDGTPATATEDHTYSLLVYTGKSMNKTGEELYKALAADSKRKATVVTLTVKKGASESEKVALDSQKVYTYQGGVWTATDANWEWKNKTYYTVVEMTDGMPEKMAFASINTSQTNGKYTFCYNTGKGWAITATNRLDEETTPPSPETPDTPPDDNNPGNPPETPDTPHDTPHGDNPGNPPEMPDVPIDETGNIVEGGEVNEETGNVVGTDGEISNVVEVSEVGSLTGDDSQMTIYGIVAAIAAAVLVIWYAIRHR